MDKEYFLGLDIGSNSVGYAVTDKNYEILKFKNKAMWGSHLFEEGEQAADRRAFRCSRRRLDRKKQRIQLARELLAKEIAKVDIDFYKRLDESALQNNDRESKSEFSLFNDIYITDESYHKRFPTIHHLIMYLIKTNEKQDIRMIYLAISYMLSHRGHFLIEVDKDDIKKVISFDTVYDSFRNYFIENELESSWTENIKDQLGDILKGKIGTQEKQRQIKRLIFTDKKKVEKMEEAIVKAISGGIFKISDLFENAKYSDMDNNNISLSDGDFNDKLSALSAYIEEKEFELLQKMKSIYDWSLLSDILKESEYLSQGKVRVYEQHKKDLALLKYLIRKYLPHKYNEVFRFSKKGLDNYVAYSGNFKSANNYENGIEKSKMESLALIKTNSERFRDYLKKLFKDITVRAEDQKVYDDFKIRMEVNNTFMPKQVNTDNGVIPYQLYRYQLKKLLENSARFYPFLLEKDEENLTIIDKFLSIIEFRVPYYVGPLNNYHGKYSWIERKCEGRILPWNFESKVDLEKSEEAFIKRMTRKCSYLAGEDVLCKNSLLYTKFMVLNEINNIKIDETPISVECKQKLYNELFLNDQRKVSKKRLVNWFVCNKYMEPSQEVRGIDDDIKSSLRSYHNFRRLLSNGILTEEQVENIIARISITTDNKRLKQYIKANFPNLDNEDIRYISSIRYKDYGRLSEKLLTKIQCVIPETGEYTNIIGALWNTNYNLMQLLSEEFDFKKQIDEHNKNYYTENPSSIESMLEEMYISNAVKRPIYRTISIVKEIKSIMKKDPEKIFIEMSRWNEKEPKQSKSRKEQLLSLYKTLDEEYKEKWISQLEREPEDRLKSERFFLYYMQLGKCMYTYEDINLDQLMDKTYDIDHIYPQSKVIDNSIHNNKVLVNSNANRLKGDKYPLRSEIQRSMSLFWSMLERKKLITKEKLYRLTRTASFKDEELAGFINRQLVETRQSTKALAKILGNLFPDSEIVYVKAGLVSDFRHQFDLPKSREINDLHHAKDAYLNIVMGNVYNVKFTKNPLNFIKTKENYSVNIKEKGGLLSRDIQRNGEVAWKSDGSTLALVKKTMGKNNINYIRFAFCRRGGFFNQNPDKASRKDSMLVPRKEYLNPEFYGGYNDATASFFTLVKHIEKGKSVISIKPVELLVAEKFKNDEEFALNYCRNRLGLEQPEFLPFRRTLKVNTLLSLDGFRVNIASKKNGGTRVGLTSCTPLILSFQQESYVKKIESSIKKMDLAKKNKSVFKISEKYHEINREQNIKLYDVLAEKCDTNIFKKIPSFSKVYTSLQVGRDKFISLAVEEQLQALYNIIKVFKTGRATGCDLLLIGGAKNSAVITLSTKISATEFSSIEVIDQSASGLFEKTSGNLLEL